MGLIEFAPPPVFEVAHGGASGANLVRVVGLTRPAPPGTPQRRAYPGGGATVLFVAPH